MIYSFFCLNRYNASSHPLPFLNISSVITTKSRPVITADMDDFIEEEVVPDDDDIIDDDDDLAKDRLIIQPRGGGRGGGRGSGRGGGRGERSARGASRRSRGRGSRGGRK